MITTRPPAKVELEEQLRIATEEFYAKGGKKQVAPIPEFEPHRKAAVNAGRTRSALGM